MTDKLPRWSASPAHAEHAASAVQDQSHDDEEDDADEAWHRLDLVFGIWVCVNGLMIGIQTDDTDPGHDEFWQVVDYTFALIFLVELVLRLLFYHQVYEEGTPDLILGIVPANVLNRTPSGNVWIMIITLPKYIRSPMALMDFLIV